MANKEHIFRAWCTVDLQYEYTGFQLTAPTVCPVNPAHAIDSSLTTSTQNRNVSLTTTLTNSVKRTSTIFADLDDMTLTPGIGRYCVFATIEVRRTTNPHIHIHVQFAVNGTPVNNSEKRISMSPNFVTFTVEGEVEVTDDSHAVTLQWKGDDLIELEVMGRTLTLLPLGE